jgi:hypothetical protein
VLIASNSIAPMEVAAVVAPVAIYFLVIGLLNSRGRPQLLSGRLDFAILALALAPLVLLPLVSWLGCSAWTVLAAAGALCAGAAVLAPRGRNWVIYNVQAAEARSAVARALRQLGLEYGDEGGTFTFAGARVQVSAFAPLRNATIRLMGGDKQLASGFQAALGEVLRRYEAETSPMAVSLLLVATSMLAAPLVLTAHRVPEIVRLLSDLVK